MPKFPMGFLITIRFYNDVTLSQVTHFFKWLRYLCVKHFKKELHLFKLNVYWHLEKKKKKKDEFLTLLKQMGVLSLTSVKPGFHPEFEQGSSDEPIIETSQLWKLDL